MHHLSRFRQIAVRLLLAVAAALCTAALLASGASAARIPIARHCGSLQITPRSDNAIRSIRTRGIG